MQVANTLYPKFLAYQWEKYTGKYSDEKEQLAKAYSNTSRAILDQYDDAINRAQQIEEFWAQRLISENWYKLPFFGRMSLEQIKMESKDKRESTEIRIGIYLGKLLQLDANEAEIQLFLGNLLKLEEKLLLNQSTDRFTEGFINCFNENNTNDRYQRLFDYCNNFSKTYFKTPKDTGNPYQVFFTTNDFK